MGGERERGSWFSRFRIRELTASALAVIVSALAVIILARVADLLLGGIQLPKPGWFAQFTLLFMAAIFMRMLLRITKRLLDYRDVMFCFGVAITCIILAVVFPMLFPYSFRIYQ